MPAEKLTTLLQVLYSIGKSGHMPNPGFTVMAYVSVSTCSFYTFSLALNTDLHRVYIRRS
jgi:hypothetical protein